MGKDASTHDGRRANGQFPSRLGHHAKQALIAKVALLAAGEDGDPLSIGRVKFDAARRQHHPELPNARSLCEQSGLSIKQLIRLALSPHEATSAAFERDASRATLRTTSDDAVIDRLRVAATAITGDLTPDAFDRWGQDREAEARRRGWAVTPEPNSQTLINRFGSWAVALKKAGVTAPKGSLRKSRPVEDLLDEFIEQMGFVPSPNYFLQWCDRMDISVGRDVKPWGEAVERTRIRRAAQGKGMPATIFARKAPPLPPKRPRVSRSKPAGWWTRERCIRALARWGREELGGRRPTTRLYRAWSKGRHDAPGLTTLQHHGTFGDLCREAGI